MFVSLPAARGIWLSIPSSGTKCVSEEIHNNVVVLADYYVINEEKPEHVPKVSVRVTSPYGNNIYHQDNVTHGQFAFTTSEAGNYLACFWLDEHQQHVTNISLGLEWKTGIAAKDWDSVAKKEKIEASFLLLHMVQGVELDLKRLEASVESIHQNLIYLKERESEMREVSERTNASVAWYSIMALGMCIAASGFQLWYLTRYFQKKKLI
ncbi:Transmembrane emp24 domain-containing protein p24delta5 [Linum perenne]